MLFDNIIYGIILLFIGLYVLIIKLEKPKETKIKINTQKQKTTNLDLANNENIEFKIKFYLIEILKNPIIKSYLESNRQTKSIQKDGKLLDTLIDNAQKLIENGDIDSELNINIKGGNVYINHKLNYFDNIYHSIFIPYSLNKLENDKYDGITIRLIMINGSLKLQVGNFIECSFNTLYDTKDLRKEHYIYRAFYDIISVPIIYINPQLFISEKHLNISKEDMGGYHDITGDKISREFSKNWDEFSKDLAMYNYIHSGGNIKKTMQIIDELKQKSKDILDRQGVILKTYRDEYIDNFNISYITDLSSRYIDVSIMDLNKSYNDNYKRHASSYVKEKFYI